MLRKLLILTVLLAACSVEPAASPDGPELPEIGAAEFMEHMSELEQPAVVNVWASWCLPCRSEAPLLDEAQEVYGDEVAFIGVDVQDSRADAQAFLSEFGLAGFDHYFDPDRKIPNAYGGIGTPITLFFSPGGELFSIHNGVVDERTLALNIDELLAGTG